jgi:UDP-glucose 4-epimerase
VGESIADPSRYYRDNVAGGVALLEAARAAQVERVVFSSTAAVYGVPDATPIPEDAPLRPINPYGESKRTFESALAWYGRAYGLRPCRCFFNVGGATETLGEVHDPKPLDPERTAAAEGRNITVFGDDTRRLMARASATTSMSPTWPRLTSAPSKRPARRSERQTPWSALGNGGGFSVRGLAAARPSSGTRPATAGLPTGRSAGPGRTWDRAAEVLGWRPAHPNLEEIVGSAWAWRLSHPDGYQE